MKEHPNLETCRLHGSVLVGDGRGVWHCPRCRPALTHGQAEEYVRWNQLSRHQLIVAHMTMVNELAMQQARLAGALRKPPYFLLDELVSEAIARLSPTE